MHSGICVFEEGDDGFGEMALMRRRFMDMARLPNDKYVASSIDLPHTSSIYFLLLLTVLT